MFGIALEEPTIEVLRTVLRGFRRVQIANCNKHKRLQWFTRPECAVLLLLPGGNCE